MTRRCDYTKGLGRRIGSAALAAVMAMSFAAPATAFAGEDGETTTTDSNAARLVSTSDDGGTKTWEALDTVKEGSVEIEMAQVAENVTVDLPTKVSGYKGGETFTWNSFNPQGQMERDHYLRVWAANEELSVTIGNFTANGGSDKTDVYYEVNDEGTGFEKANDGVMSVKMPTLPAAVAGIASGTQKYNLQIVDEMATTNSTDNSTNAGTSGEGTEGTSTNTGDEGTSTNTSNEGTEGTNVNSGEENNVTYSIYMDGSPLTETDADGNYLVSLKKGDTATFTVVDSNGNVSSTDYYWHSYGIGASGDYETAAGTVIKDRFAYGSSLTITGTTVGSNIYISPMVNLSDDAPVAYMALTIEDDGTEEAADNTGGEVTPSTNTTYSVTSSDGSFSGVMDDATKELYGMNYEMYMKQMSVGDELTFTLSLPAGVSADSISYSFYNPTAEEAANQGNCPYCQATVTSVSDNKLAVTVKATKSANLSSGMVLTPSVMWFADGAEVACVQIGVQS